MGVPHKVAVPTPPFWAANTLLTSQMQMTPSAAPVMPRPSSMLFDLEVRGASIGSSKSQSASRLSLVVALHDGSGATICLVGNANELRACRDLRTWWLGCHRFRDGYLLSLLRVDGRGHRGD